MKIKTKKQLTLPQLIEWGFENDIREKSFYANEYVGEQRQELHFNAAGIPKFSAFVEKSNTFTVEVEETVTEDTKLFLVERYIDNEGNSEYHKYKESSIKNAIENNPSYYETTHFYIENDDRELILIWRDGKLVE